MDSYVSFSNSDNLDLFPSFKSFHQPQPNQSALPAEEKDSTDTKPIIPVNSSSSSSPGKSKATNLKSDVTKKSTTTNPSVQCDICSVPISSEVVYRTHINGRKHQSILTALISKNPQYKTLTYEELCSKKMELLVVNDTNESIPTNSIDNSTPTEIPAKQWPCHVCNVTCNSQPMFDKHLVGKKHQMKSKTLNLNNPTVVRTVPDNNPSSSNYCDVCSLQLKSESELTEHLAHPRHQLKVKDAEICAKAATEMKINFDDYKVANPSTTEKNPFQYECVQCGKKTIDKVQLVSHLKSPLHARIVNQANKQSALKNIRQGRFQTKSGGPMRNNLGNRTRGAPNKPVRQSRPYPLNRPNQTQPYQESTSGNIFGAFDPYNQAYPSTKPASQHDEIPNGYDGFYPKPSDTYSDGTNRPKDFSSTSGYDYSKNSEPYTAQTTNYSNQSQPSWQYQNQSHYDQQQYSNPQNNYMDSTYYSLNQPPLPNYEQPPLPNYPPPSSDGYYSQNSTYDSSGNHTRTNHQYYSSFQN